MRHFCLRKETGDFLKGKHGTLATLANFSNLGRSLQSGCLIGSRLVALAFQLVAEDDAHDDADEAHDEAAEQGRPETIHRETDAE